MRTRIFLLVFSLLPFFNLHAQKKQGQARLDSLLAEVPKMKEDTTGVKLLDQISFLYERIDPDEGLKWAGEELHLAQKVGWQPAMAMAYVALGNSYQAKGAYPAALDAFFRSLRISEAGRDKSRIGAVSSNLGLLYLRQKDYPKALEWSLKGLKIAEEQGNKGLMETTLSNIGNVYGEQGMHCEALGYELRALRIAEEVDNKRDIIIATGNIGADYAQLRQYNAALVYHFKALRKAGELGNSQSKVVNLGNIGEAYYLIATDSMAPKPDSLVPASRPAALAKAVAYLNKSIIAAREIQFSEAIPEFTGYLSQAFALQGDYKNALAAYKQRAAINESLYNIANKEKITNLETRRELELKDKDIQIAKLAVAKKRNERAFYIAGIALLLLIMGILLYNFRRHERSRQRIRALQDHKISLLDEAVKRRTEQLGSIRQTIATDFHDQTGNMLAAITRQAATLELRLLQQPEILPMVRSIISNANELYASSKDFLWNLNHDSDDPFILFQYLSGYGQRFYNQFDISFSTTMGGMPQPHMQLHPFAGLNLIYIFKEAMSNVIRHSGADEVCMELDWGSFQVVYSLQDNGTWKVADSSTEHYGLGNMERRCRQSGFGYKLTHGASGTRIEVSLPVSKDAIGDPGPSASGG